MRRGSTTDSKASIKMATISATATIAPIHLMAHILLHHRLLFQRSRKWRYERFWRFFYGDWTLLFRGNMGSFVGYRSLHERKQKRQRQCHHSGEPENVEVRQGSGLLLANVG